MMKRADTSFAAFMSLLLLSIASGEEPRALSGSAAPGIDQPGPVAVNRVSVAEARRQSALLHTAIHSTLQAVHHHYYRLDEGLPIPAATLKEVFAELEKEHHVTLRWLAVEGQAMNSDHKPKTAFEEDAVAKLKSGTRQIEIVENGVYRQAAAITLTNQCLKCHVPNRKNTQDRTAGLIIAIPIEEK